MYREVLAWKGVVGAQQQQVRQLHEALRRSPNKEVARLQADLDQAARSMAALSNAPSKGDPDREFRLQESAERIERLQQQLATASAEFRRQRQQQRRAPDEICRVLPPETALLDLLCYERRQPRKAKGKSATASTLIAFVVHSAADRSSPAVERVEVGLRESISAAVTRWRESIGHAAADGEAGQQLRQLVWLPLERHVQHARTLLFSPNSLTAPVPWAALPGSKPGSYLIEEKAVGLVAIPALLPELLAAAPADAGPVGHGPSLLLVGDVDFGADPGRKDLLADSRSAIWGDRSLFWPALPGTRREVSAIRDAFHRQFAGASIDELTGQHATKDALRNATGNFEYVHFATHGFFAPPPNNKPSGDAASASGQRPAHGVSGTGSVFPPGLLSGLVLAGANHAGEDGKDDGILTALEVGQMDLSHVRVATLSACETGLGQAGGGEGLLGLQRAFQTAGAHTVIASLWRVPDEETQRLMAAFYTNLWQRKLPALDALRQAQLAMLRNDDPHAGRLRAPVFSQTVTLSAGGATVKPPAVRRTTLPPVYWAAFELSGDWR
jgi:CHAT domain-containing protein